MRTPYGSSRPGGGSTRHPMEQTPLDQAPPPLGTRHPLPTPRADPLGAGTPHPPVDRILDTRLRKYYFAPNFVCGGNKNAFHRVRTDRCSGRH